MSKGWLQHEERAMKALEFGEGFFSKADPLFASDYFLPPLFPPLYYFHPNFKISSADLFLYCREPLKIITETIAAHLKTFWDAVWTTQQAKPQRAEALFQASKNGCWVALIACANGHFVIQLPACADTQRTLPSFTYVRVFQLWKRYSFLL